MSYTNLHIANLVSQISNFYTGSFIQAHPRLNDPPEGVDTDPLKQPARAILHGCPHDRNEATRESREKELHERVQSQPRFTTYHFLYGIIHLGAPSS